MIYTGDCLDILPTLPEKSVQCCVTSPPYWGLRDYGTATWEGGEPGCDHKQGRNGSGRADGIVDERGQRNRDGVGSMGGDCRKCGATRIDNQIGLEKTSEEYVAKMVEVFRMVKRVLRDDGSLWINLGDSYAANRSYQVNGTKQTKNSQPRYGKSVSDGLKPKDLCMIPFRVAMALQADGWYLRSVCPWIKRNCMPESCKDRPTNAIEYLFLLSKSEKYYYDYEAGKIPASSDTHARYARGRSVTHKYADGGPGGQTIAASFDHMRKPGVNPKAAENAPGSKQNESFASACKDVVGTRARRNSDWFFDSFQGLLQDSGGDPLAFIVNSKGFKGAHFATFPPKLVEPCIKAGSKPGDNVCDPFAGAGTVGYVCEKLDRRFIGIELNPAYVKMAESRIYEVQPLFSEAIL